jgi:hypothetical protein
MRLNKISICKVLTLVCVSTFVFVSTTYSQKFSNINFSFVTQAFNNQVNIVNDNKDPNPISAQNTFGYSFFVGYQRAYKSGIYWMVDLGYSTQNHNISFKRDLSNFDSTAKQNLSGYTFNERIVYNVSYINPRFFVGYSYTLCKKMSLQIAAGYSKKIYNSSTYIPEKDFEKLYALSYYTDDYNTFYNYSFLRISTYNFRTNIDVFHAYFGSQLAVNYKYLKNLSFGIEFSKNISSPLYIYTLSWRQRGPYDDINNVSVDEYASKEYSFGIRITAGLWK